jgi:FMN phosphatase YigB (HAD superfamily)
MNEPYVVVFDLGKVLLDFDYTIALGRIASRSRFSVDQLKSLLLETPLLHSYESGQIDSREFFERFARKAGFADGYPAFRESFADIFSPIQPMIELQGELRESGTPTFVLSNTNEIAVSHIRERYRFFSGFDGYVFSYQEGVMKPEAAIYSALERSLARFAPAPRVLYLDDRSENVEAAVRRGWEGVVHVDPAASRQALRSAGVLR